MSADVTPEAVMTCGIVMQLRSAHVLYVVFGDRDH